MTGFGRAERSSDGVAVSLQVSSVNRKNLEVVCVLPKEFQSLERAVVERAKAEIGRGRVQFSVEIRDERNESGGLPSDEQMDAAINRIKAISSRHGGASSLDTATITSLAQLLESEPSRLPEDIVKSHLLECADAALKELVSMRSKEGAALEQDLRSRCRSMMNTVEDIKKEAPSMLSKHRDNLYSRLEQAGLEIDLDDERVLKELALFADRCDLSEEMTRLDSHFEQFMCLLEKDEPVGRSLEFLIQEIARETNTTGSKSCSIEVSKSALALKNELERIREQVANVE